MNPLVLQLVDSAFPTGGFAHSGGFEALHQLGLLRGDGLTVRLEELVWHTALGALPFVNGAHTHPPIEVDRAAEVFLVNHVARRASQAQGRAFLLAAAATLEDPRVEALRAGLPHSHHAVAFSAVLALHDTPLDEVRQAFLFATVRSALSSVVRLGAIGPLKAQAELRRLAPTLSRALHETRALTVADASSTSTWLETAQPAHDRLYSRLFQS